MSRWKNSYCFDKSKTNNNKVPGGLKYKLFIYVLLVTNWLIYWPSEKSPRLVYMKSNTSTVVTYTDHYS